VLIQPPAPGAATLELDVPADFHEVPLDAQTENRVAAQLQVLEDLGLDDPAQREAVSLYLEALTARLGTDNVVGSAFCVVQIHGHPSTASLSLALQPTHTPDAGLAVLGAAEALHREGRHGRVEVVTLGGRPAVVAMAERPGRADDRDGPRATDSVRELSVLVPVPDQRQAVVVTLSTPCLQDWDVYERLTLDIARSLRVRAAPADLTG